MASGRFGLPDVFLAKAQRIGLFSQEHYLLTIDKMLDKVLAGYFYDEIIAHGRFFLFQEAQVDGIVGVTKVAAPGIDISFSIGWRFFNGIVKSLVLKQGDIIFMYCIFVPGDDPVTLPNINEPGASDSTAAACSAKR